MSLGIIPYQPIAFGLEENCTLPCSSWVQKIARTDRTSFQFTFGACGTTNNVLENGDFSDDGTGWTIINDWTFGDNVAISPAETLGWIEHPIVGQAGLYYEITFTVEINNGTMFIASDDGIIETYTASGTYTVVIDSEDMLVLLWYFDTPLGGTLSNVIWLPLTNRVVIGIFDLNDNYVATVPNAYLIYTAGYLTVSIENWEVGGLGIPNGCYKFAALDPCQCAQFGFFGEDFEWPSQFVVVSGGANVTIGGGTMEVLNSGITSAAVSKLNVACVGTTYLIEYTLSGMVGADTFQIRIGTANGTVQTADGTYSESITVTATNDNLQDIRFLFGIPAGLHLVTLSDFSFEASEPIITYESQPFQLVSDTVACACTVLVAACGNGDQLNFGFTGTGFKPIIRLEGTYRGGGYPSVRTSYEHSSGNKVTPYARMRKAKTLAFGAPEYVHDFMQLLLFLDNVYIEGVAKYCEDQEYPTPSLDENVDYGTISMTFTDKIELTEKRPCAATAPIGCAEDGYALGFSGTGGDGGVGESGLTVQGTNGVNFAANRKEAINGVVFTYNG